jgi:beta-carotene ketolase (CrtO type)
MSKEERYDFVIIGAGPNGTALGAYLAKSGQSVCLLEERPEAGGGCENAYPIPGVRIDPHTTFMYAGAAPGFDQLELWKYGFRMSWHPTFGRPETGLETLELRKRTGTMTTEGRVPLTDKDVLGWAKLCGILGDPPFARELLRAIYYCPPHPPEVEITPENIPYMQVYKQHAPDIWTEELLDMTMFELMDEYCETESYKVQIGLAAWYCGASPEWEGVAIPALGGVLAVQYTGASVPRGGMHTYFHSIIRCAMAHGAVIRTCCPVDEIILREGRAVGVRLRDTATWGEKTIYANKGVVSAIDVQQTFLKLIGPQHMDVSFLQRIKDISLKGSSIYVTHYLFSAPTRYRPKFAMEGQPVRMAGGLYPCDSRELYFEHIMDINARKGSPSMPPDRVPWIAITHDEDPWRCTLPDRYLLTPMYVIVPPPEYHVEGPDAMAKERDKWDAYMLKALSAVVENAEDDLVQMWSNPPWESEHRNVGLIGGGWYTTRHCKDQLWTNRPLPEYSRYRSPIDGLYFCHQTSGHPGGLALMAIPYNLMHILIEDGLVEPGDWWYPSPWYIPQQGKISAIPRK